MKSSLELIDVKTNVTVPEKIFEIPVGYKKASSF
jgi:hypothetical protein